MKYPTFFHIILSAFLFLSCQNKDVQKIQVHDMESLNSAIHNAKPGDEIIMANGVWSDAQINFKAKGTKDNPVILRAETEGKVTIEGKSHLKLGGEYLIVSGLFFKNGYAASNTVIDFRINKDSIANHCIVTNCVIEDFNQPNRYDGDHWVDFWGRHNELVHCYLGGKFNEGPTIVVNLDGNEHSKNYHKISNNHFGPRPRKGGPSAETMRIGDSGTSMVPAHVIVSDNFFERCNGEVEIISNKSNHNEFRNNIFFESEGSLVMRHGNYCIVDGNILIGNNKPFVGGIRIINTGHWVTNNYFYAIAGEEFRSALAIMNGVPKSPLNRYNQVTDVVVAYNSWIDCVSPLQISVGANMDKSGVLPDQEIRSARPERVLFADNLIYNQSPDSRPLVNYDKVDGITFKNNLIDNQSGEFEAVPGLETVSLEMDQINSWLFVPSSTQFDKISNVYQGLDFESIQHDLFGNDRNVHNAIGAVSQSSSKYQEGIDYKKYGASWFESNKVAVEPKVISVSSAEGELSKKISEATDGDILELTDEKYTISDPLLIGKKITIKSKDTNKRVNIDFTADESVPAFRLLPKGKLILDGVSLHGKKNNLAFAPLDTNNSSPYNIKISNSSISDFQYILKAYKGSFADSISFSGVNFSDCNNGIELASETDDKGDYNAEVLSVKNCDFKNINQNVINFYRGGYDESTIGGNLFISKSTFSGCGKAEKDGILIKTRGIINVDLSDNIFTNNSPKFIAILWGEKNNHERENEISNSGEILVEQYLKQKQIY